MKHLIKSALSKVLPEQVVDFAKELELLYVDVESILKSAKEIETMYVTSNDASAIRKRRVDNAAAKRIRDQIVFPLDVHVSVMNRQHLAMQSVLVSQELPLSHPYRDDPAVNVLSESTDDLHEVMKNLRLAKSIAWKVHTHPQQSHEKFREWIVECQKHLRDALSLLRKIFSNIEFANEEFSKHTKGLDSQLSA